MSGARILYPQFRDEQSDSRYPFSDRATLLSSERKLDIGRATFIDASLYAIGGDKQAYISAIVVGPQSVTIQIGDSGNKNRASVTYNPADPPESGVLTLADSYGRPAGMLLSSSTALAIFGSWPFETHTFKQANAEFVSSVVIPAKEAGVRAVKTPTGSLLTGDVWLVGDQGIVLRAVDDRTIRVDVVGEPLFVRHLCSAANLFSQPTFVKTLTVNGISCGPDAYGNFIFTATGHEASDTILRVYTQDGNVKIDTVGRKVV